MHRTELRLGEAKKAGAAVGDHVEVRYASWLLQGGVIGQVGGRFKVTVFPF